MVMFPSWEYRPLRPGPGRSREEVAADQRSRLQRAVIELVAEDGYQALTVRSLAKRAQVSSGAFYQHYRSTDECFLSTYDLICRRVAERCTEAGQRGQNPRERATLAIDRLLRDIAAAPQVATFVLRAAPAAGPVFTGTLRSSGLHIVRVLESCLRSDDQPDLPRPLLEGVVGGLARIGRLQEPMTADDEIEVAAAEAAAWVMSICGFAQEEASGRRVRGSGLRSARGAAGKSQDDGRTAAPGDDRGMILSAAFRIARGGYHRLTVQGICREAGVPRRNFGRHFASLEDCFSTALESRVAILARSSRRNRTAPAAWRGSLLRAHEMIRGVIDGDAHGGRLLLVEIFAAGTPGVASRDRLISQIAQTVRDTAPADHRPTGLEAEASTAAAWTILAVRLNGCPGR
jgi:AcrR family transcriptional regulator